MYQKLEAVVPFEKHQALELQVDRYGLWLEKQSDALSVFEEYLKDNKLVLRADEISGHLIRLLLFLPMEMSEDAKELEWPQQRIRVGLFKQCATIQERNVIDVFLDSFLNNFCVKNREALLKRPFGSPWDTTISFVNQPSHMKIILASGLGRALLKRHLLSTPLHEWQKYLETDVIELFKDSFSGVEFELRDKKLSATCMNYVNNCKGYDMLVLWNKLLQFDSEKVPFQSKLFEAGLTNEDLIKTGRRCKMVPY
jgi:hypothetical protein